MCVGVLIQELCPIYVLRNVHFAFVNSKLTMAHLVGIVLVLVLY